jgi:hypothetical protein
MKLNSLYLLIYEIYLVFSTRNGDISNFCSNKPSGIYCHPGIGSLRIYCDLSGVSNLISCPKDFTCRPHSKLNTIFNNDYLPAAQCVHKAFTDLDAFCEDKLSELELPNNRTIDTIDAETVLLTDKFCNPFSAERKHTLTCSIIQKSCGNFIPKSALDDFLDVSEPHNEGICFESIEIYHSVDSCDDNKVCRSYENDYKNSVIFGYLTSRKHLVFR